MKTVISTKPLLNVETPLLAVIVTPGAGVSPLKDASLERAVTSGDYKGQKDETLLVYGAGKAERILLVGAGKPTEITRSAIRRASAIAARRARSLGTPRVLEDVLSLVSQGAYRLALVFLRLPQRVARIALAL